MLLHRPDVLDGALALLDARGLDGITMRRLGASLNVQAGALYRHFPSKEALIDALAERLLEGITDDLPAASWYDRLRVLADRLRAALLTHRDGARVVAGTYVTGPNTLTAGEAAVETLCDAGLAPDQAGWITFAVFYYVLGHTVEEQAQAQLPPQDNWPSRLARAEAGPSPRFAQALDSLTGADPAERFAYGMRILLNGISQEIELPRADQWSDHP